MVPTIESGHAVESNVAAFYDGLAVDYDMMTEFDKRFIHERPFFRLLAERYGIATALDAGCGTGFHSLVLARLGVHVTAVDISRNMLNRVEQHAQEMQLPIVVIESSFQDLPQSVHTRFDAVFSMGNSLTHILSKDELGTTLRGFARLLKPKGILFLQNLNYDRILAGRERIQSVKEVQGVTFVRYYEYAGELINFHILRLEKDKASVQHELRTVQLRPILYSELHQLLPDAGFNDVKFFGGIAMEEYQPTTSKDLVVLAQMPGG